LCGHIELVVDVVGLKLINIKQVKKFSIYIFVSEKYKIYWWILWIWFDLIWFDLIWFDLILQKKKYSFYTVKNINWRIKIYFNTYQFTDKEHTR
jgi:hypothetical protein